MDLFAIMHDPNWTKVTLTSWFALGGWLLLIALYIRYNRNRKVVNFEKQVQDAIAKGKSLPEPVFTQPGFVLGETSAKDIPVTRKIVITTLVACLTVFTLSTSAFDLRFYTVLSNWSDGDQRETSGDHVGAILCYKKALRADPALMQSHLLIGKSLLAAGKAASALPELEMASQNATTGADAFKALGDAHRDLQHYSDAIEAYRKAIDLQPRQAQYEVDTAICMDKLGLSEDAYQAYLRAVKKNNRSANARMLLGEHLIRAGHFNESIANFECAVRLEPNNAHAHYNLATAYGRLSNYAGAVEEYRKAIDLSPRMVEAHFNLAATLARMHKMQFAQEEFNACLAIQPQTSEDVRTQRNARTILQELTPIQ